MKKKLLSIFSITALLTMSVNAQIVNPVSMESDLAILPNIFTVNVLNGTGLNTFPSLTASHGPSVPTNSYLGGEPFGAGVVTGNLVFDLGEQFPIQGLSFWNMNAGGPGGTGDSGIRQVAITSSVDGETYTPIEGAPTAFKEVNVQLAPPEVFEWEVPVLANFIRIEVLSNHGNERFTGFAEIAFLGDPTLSIDDTLLDDAITLHPNPATSDLYITNGTNLKLNTIAIYDITGRKTLELNSGIEDDQVIDVSSLKSGVYMVKINGGNGETVKRFFKK